jgi:enterochelin esterase-like enzyme
MIALSLALSIFEADEDPAKTKVTFVWRGDASTKNVVVMFDGEPDFQNLQLRPLTGTDIWHRTFRIPKDARFYYQFAPNDTLVPFDAETDLGKRETLFVADPTNPAGIKIGNRAFSFAISPFAPPLKAYEDRGSPKGDFRPPKGAFLIRSETLGGHRVWVYGTPGLLEKGGSANMIVFLDGSGAWQLIESRRMLDNLFAEKKLGPTFAVYTDSPNRDRDLGCSDAYLDFLITEVVSWAKNEFNIKTDAKRTVISGRSLGGLFAGYAVLKRPDVFGSALMQSPSLWWGAAKDGENEWLTRQIAAAKKGPGRFYLSPGVFEVTSNSRSSISILTSTRHLRDVLTAKGYAFGYREVSGGHDPLNWQASLPDGLLYSIGR